MMGLHHPALRAVALTISPLLLAAPLHAGQAVKELGDIQYQDSSWGETELRKRGYHRMSSDDHRGTEYQYWWNGNHCVQVQIGGRKVQELSITTPTDCGQHHDEAVKGNKGAALAAAAAVLIGAALVHQSHERDGKHGEDAKSIADFDRGYRDGLHREDYHNYNNSAAYSDGFNAGVEERSEQTSHRSHGGRQSGYQPHVSLSDLNGARSGSAESELESRGFRSTGNYKQGSRSMTTWYNGQTHQCVQLVNRDGHVESINDLFEGNCQ